MLSRRWIWIALWLGVWGLLGCDAGPGSMKDGAYITAVTSLDGDGRDLTASLVYGAAARQMALRQGQEVTLMDGEGKTLRATYHEVDYAYKPPRAAGMHLILGEDSLELRVIGEAWVNEARRFLGEGKTLTIHR